MFIIRKPHDILFPLQRSIVTLYLFSPDASPSASPKACTNEILTHLMTSPGETVNFEGNKINCFPHDQSLSVLLYSWKSIQPRGNGGPRSTFAGNSALLPSDVIVFSMLPA